MASTDPGNSGVRADAQVGESGRSAERGASDTHAVVNPQPLDVSSGVYQEQTDTPLKGVRIVSPNPFPSAHIQGMAQNEGLVLGKVRYLPATEEKWSGREISFETTLEKSKLDQAYQRTLDGLPALVEYLNKAAQAETKKTEGEVTPSTPQAMFELVLKEAYERAGKFISEDFRTASAAIYQAFRVPEESPMGRFALDCKALRQEFQSALNGVDSNPFAPLEPGTVLVGRELTPFQLGRLQPLDNVVGYLCERGAGHAAIEASARGWAGVTNAQNFGLIKNGDTIIVDGSSGGAFLNPNDELLRLFAEHSAQRIPTGTLEQISSSTVTTLDGRHRVVIKANIGKPSDMEQVLKVFPAAEIQIGLWRAEDAVIAPDGKMVSEETQVAIYKPVVAQCKGNLLILRLVDYGGEKAPTGENVRNPELGSRGIQYSLRDEHTRAELRVQLRALLQAAVEGPIGILIPMVNGPYDVLEVKKEFERAKQELVAENKSFFSRNIKFGAMIETPSSILTLRDICQVVDFCSIGTNDLTQYVLANERGHVPTTTDCWVKKFGPHHPAILSCLKSIIETCNQMEVAVTGCGDMFSKQFYAPLFIGLGLPGVSVPPRRASVVETEVSGLGYQACKEFTDWALTGARGDPVRVYDELYRFFKCIREGKPYEVPAT